MIKILISYGSELYGNISKETYDEMINVILEHEKNNQMKTKEKKNIVMLFDNIISSGVDVKEMEEIIRLASDFEKEGRNMMIKKGISKEEKKEWKNLASAAFSLEISILVKEEGRDEGKISMMKLKKEYEEYRELFEEKELTLESIKKKNEELRREKEILLKEKEEMMREIEDVRKKIIIPLNQQVIPSADDNVCDHTEVMDKLNISLASFDGFQMPLLNKILLNNLNEEGQKQLLGEVIFLFVEGFDRKRAGKITGMIIELPLNYVIDLVEHPVTYLIPKVIEAENVLDEHSY